MRGRPFQGILKQAADFSCPLIFGIDCNILSIQQDRSGITHNGTADYIQQRALSGTVGPQHTDKVTILHMEGQMIQSLSLIDGIGVKGYADIL